MNDAPAPPVTDVNAASPSRGPARWAALGLGVALTVPSLGVVQRYAGNWGSVIYLAAATAGLLLLLRYRVAVTKWAAQRSPRQVVWLTALTFAVIVAAFVVVYPLANLHRPDAGSDGDDALNIAVTELIHVRYPYYPPTYLGNPISPLPGAVLLALPFVLLGSCAYQNLFWLFVFFLAMRSYLLGSRSVLLLLWVMLALSPALWYALVTGSDYVANALYVLLFSLWLIRAAARSGDRARAMLIAGLLGVGLSSRANFLLLMPLLFVALGRVADWRTAVRLTVIVGLAFAAVTAPFYLVDPGGFTPLHTTDELGRFDVVIPHAGVLIPLLTAALALLLALWPGAWPERVNDGRVQEARGRIYADDVTAEFFRNSALVLALPVFCGLVLYCVGLRRLYFGFATFGVFFLFFGAVPAWRTMFRPISLDRAAGESATGINLTGKMN
jgi:hypothetical protein